MENKLPPVNSAPPAQITLTPAAPSAGANTFMVVFGVYGTRPGYFYISLDPSAYAGIQMQFMVTPKMTYLLDVTVDTSDTQEWSCSVGTLCNSNIKPQHGHLLIPFYNTNNLCVMAEIYPSTNISQFYSAELTQGG
jgi:hypothetical protein